MVTSIRLIYMHFAFIRKLPHFICLVLDSRSDVFLEYIIHLWSHILDSVNSYLRADPRFSLGIGSTITIFF